MALERERRSLGFEREDERRRVVKSMKRVLEKGMTGLGIGEIVGMEKDSHAVKIEVSLDPTPPTIIVMKKKVAKAPSVALMGVSMLGSRSILFPILISVIDVVVLRSRWDVQVLSVSSDCSQLVRRPPIKP